jgi:pyrroline-5-carboxylate reductase
MDAATAISGCGPAFFALVAESLVDAGVKEGLDARQAARLAMTTMGGTAELMRHRGGDAVGLRRAVTSPGGVTAVGLAALEGYGVRAAFGAAVEAVVEKAKAAQAPPAEDST